MFGGGVVLEGRALKTKFTINGKILDVLVDPSGHAYSMLFACGPLSMDIRVWLRHVEHNALLVYRKRNGLLSVDEEKQAIQEWNSPLIAERGSDSPFELWHNVFDYYCAIGAYLATCYAMNIKVNTMAIHHMLRTVKRISVYETSFESGVGALRDLKRGNPFGKLTIDISTFVNEQGEIIDDMDSNMYFPGNLNQGVVIKSISRCYSDSLTISKITPHNNAVKAHDLPVNVKGPYLDVGGGDESLTELIAKHYRFSDSSVTVVDTYNKPSRYRRILSNGDQRWPISDKSQGLVTMNMSIHHIADINFTMSEVNRVLKKGGTLYIKEHDVLNSHTADYIEQLHQYFAEQEKRDYGNVFYYSQSNLIRYLSTIGFDLQFKSAIFGKSRKYTMVLVKYRNMDELFAFTPIDLTLCTRRFLILEMVDYFKINLSQKRLVDITAGIGCDIINMMSTGLFETGIAIEKDDSKYGKLINNVAVSRLKIQVLRLDSVTVLDRFNSSENLIYIDPLFESMSVSGYDIRQLLEMVPNCFCIIKTPREFTPQFKFISVFKTKSLQFFLSIYNG